MIATSYFFSSGAGTTQHNRGQVSGSMNADPINMIHTNKQSTKEGLNEKLKGDFRSSKSIN